MAYYFHELYAGWQREFLRGFSGKVSGRFYDFDPTYPFGFHRIGDDPDEPVYREFATTELQVEARYARDETFLQNGNERISLGLRKWPALYIRYTHGFKGILGSDYDYDKARVSLDKRIRMGFLGVGNLNLTYEYIWGKLPYPLLNVHLGNQ